jgi:UDP-N-acetylglucosamine diphosphorylase/glucosamine-1-phosphate N-acetyltransferase
MPEIILFEDTLSKNLYPFHLIEGVGQVRHGAWTQQERWSNAAAVFGPKSPHPELHINARWIANDDAVQALSGLTSTSVLVHDGVILASTAHPSHAEKLTTHQMPTEPDLLRHANQLFTDLEVQLLADLPQLRSQWNLTCLTPVAPTHIFGSNADVLISPTAQIKAASIDTTKGPVVIGPNAILEPGCHIEGPVLIHEGATVKMGACIKGASVIGPYCKVGGEVSNVHFQGWANKAHEGFLGNSVIGKWCNLGAGSNASNLKNTYGNVRQWSYASQTLEDTGLQFCGLLMGDHSKCGIGSTFNTGTIIGPASVIFDSGFPPKHIPPFSWFNAKTGTMRLHDFEKMTGTAEKVMSRRKVSMSDGAFANLSALFARRSAES